MAGGEPEIKYIEIGEPPFQQDLTILDEESIKRLKVGAIVSGATGFEKQIVTMNPTNGKFPEDCTIRTLVPATGADEGHASGPANYTASPDWAPQKRTGYKPTTFTLPMMSLPTHLRSLCPDF